MKQLFISIILIMISFQSFGQEFIDDSNFESKINEKHAFGDNDQNIVVVEFWAKFNEANAFADWDKVKGVKYFRIDVGSSPEMKKKYRIRFLIRGAKTLKLQNSLASAIPNYKFQPGIKLSVDVDPINFN